MHCPSCGVLISAPTIGRERFVACPACGSTVDVASLSTMVQASATSKNLPQSALGRINAPDLVGRHLDGDRYLIHEKIGEGGMGSVYRGVQLRLQRPVAIKVLSGELVGETKFIERFRREACTLATFRHPHIVSVIDSGEEGRLHYLVMNYIDGPRGAPMTLRDLIDTKGLTTRHVFTIVEQACSALQYAHENGIIHRDIKPSNFLIDRAGNVHLADFGIASTRGITADTTLTATGSTLGTIRYMSPEQRRDPTTVDARTDIYSMGIVFYEMLAGEVPDIGSKAPSAIRKDVPPAIDSLILHALQREPAKRMPSVREFAAALQRAIVPAPVSIAPDATPTVEKKIAYRMPPQQRRPSHALRITIAALAFVAVATAGYSARDFIGQLLGAYITTSKENLSASDSFGSPSAATQVYEPIHTPSGDVSPEIVREVPAENTATPSIIALRLAQAEGNVRPALEFDTLLVQARRRFPANTDEQLEQAVLRIFDLKQYYPDVTCFSAFTTLVSLGPEPDPSAEPRNPEANPWETRADSKENNALVYANDFYVYMEAEYLRPYLEAERRAALDRQMQQQMIQENIGRMRQQGEWANQQRAMDVQRSKQVSQEYMDQMRGWEARTDAWQRANGLK